ncbi:WXG100 family type VII secretion target [Actinophytocola sediminis]
MSDELSVDQRAMVADLVGLTGADPVLTESHNWAGYTHQALYEGVHGNNDPGAATQLAAEWATTSNSMLESSLSMIDVVKASAGAWEGEAATATRKALDSLGEWGANTSAISLRVSKQLDEQATIMAEAKAAMPEPVDFDLATEVAKVNSQPTLAGFVQSLNDLHAGHAKATNAQSEAVAVMSRMEERSRSVDQSIPVFAAPPDPISRTTARNLARPVTPQENGVPSEQLSARILAEGQSPQNGVAPTPFNQVTQPGAVAPTPFNQAIPGGDGTTTASSTPFAPAASLPGAGDPNALRVPPGSPALPTTPAGGPGGVGGWQPPMPTMPSSTIPQVSMPRSMDSPTISMPSPPKPGGPNSSTTVSGFNPAIPGGRPPGAPNLPTSQRPGGYDPSLPYGPPGGPRAFGPNGPSGRNNPSNPNLPPGGVQNPNNPNLPGRGFGPGGTNPGGGPGMGTGGGGGMPPRGVNLPGGGPGGGMGGAGTPANAGAGQPGMRGPGELANSRFGGSIGGAPGQGGGMSPGMGGGRGQGDDDKERSSAYRVDEDLFEVPGVDLPPSVIGGKKPKQDDS